MTGIPSLGSSNTPSCLLPQELDTLWLDGPSWLECKLTLSLKKGKLGNFSFNLSKMWVLFQTLVDFFVPFFMFDCGLCAWTNISITFSISSCQCFNRRLCMDQGL